ncbi:MAG: hypothetical protein NVS1B6_15820 [Steroidobacteraceae bacterium]
MAEKTAALSVRISPVTKDALARMAAADKRSLASYVALVLDQHVATTRSARKPK